VLLHYTQFATVFHNLIIVDTKFKMGKVRRYKKKLAKAAEGTTNDGNGNEQTNYLSLAEELMKMKKDDDKMSVCSVMKSVKSCSGGESLKLKKDAKRCLKHAFLIKSLLFKI
jgi:hypothetical protein